MGFGGEMPAGNSGFHRTLQHQDNFRSGMKTEPKNPEAFILLALRPVPHVSNIKRAT